MAKKKEKEAQVSIEGESDSIELSPEEMYAYQFADDMVLKAINEFENENSKTPFSEKLSNIRNALIWGSFTGIKMTQKYGANNMEREKQMEKHSEYMRYFAEIEKMYASELRANKISGRNNEAGMNSAFLKRIKNMTQSTVGSVVRKLND